MRRKSASRSRPGPPSENQRALSAREETMLFLFRQLSLHQQREKILSLQALVDANRIVGKSVKGPLKPASNEDVRAAFKDVPDEPRLVRKKRKKKPDRDLGDAMGDYLDD